MLGAYSLLAFSDVLVVMVEMVRLLQTCLITSYSARFVFDWILPSIWTEPIRSSGRCRTPSNHSIIASTWPSAAVYFTDSAAILTEIDLLKIHSFYWWHLFAERSPKISLALLTPCFDGILDPLGEIGAAAFFRFGCFRTLCAHELVEFWKGSVFKQDYSFVLFEWELALDNGWALSS